MSLNYVSLKSVKNIACVDDIKPASQTGFSEYNRKGPRIHGLKMTSSYDQIEIITEIE